MRPANYPVWLEVLDFAVCFAIAGTVAYLNYRARRRLFDELIRRVSGQH